jgi:RimJ/RimL family protein N-acetyltransferase
MDLEDVWPLFRLSLRTPRLELRVVRDDDLGPLVDAALAGIHKPDVMPFAAPWTDADPDELRRSFARHQWMQRLRADRHAWCLNLVVLHEGTPIGIQDVLADRFPVLRTVVTGSWLTASQHGRGFGTEMRAAVLAFAFDHLGAEIAETSAGDFNAASVGVSRRLGYRDNGETRIETRPGVVMRDLRMRLEPDAFVRPDWTLEVEGVAETRRELGLDG